MYDTPEYKIKPNIEVDTILCHDKADAHKVIDCISGKYINDFQCLENGKILIILNCKIENIPGVKKCK